MELKVCLSGIEGELGDKALPRRGHDCEQASIHQAGAEQQYCYLQSKVSQTRCFLAVPPQHHILCPPAVNFSTTVSTCISQSTRTLQGRMQKGPSCSVPRSLTDTTTGYTVLHWSSSSIKDLTTYPGVAQPPFPSMTYLNICLSI